VTELEGRYAVWAVHLPILRRWGRDGDGMTLLTEGQMIRDFCAVERFLGEGAPAETYRLQHRLLGRRAMKALRFPGGSTEKIEAWAAEALLLARISHSNIIRVFPWG
jgi:hypothetical protein